MTIDKTIDDLLSFGCMNVPDYGGKPERTTAKRFVGVYQAGDNWCWAAAAASVATYFDTKRKPDGPIVKQCCIVDRGADMNNPVRACTKQDRPCCGKFFNVADTLDHERSYCRNVEQDKEGFLSRVLDEQGMLAGWVSLRSGRSRASKHPDARPVPPLDSRMDIEAFDDLLREGHLICLRTRRRGSRHFIIVYGCETYPNYSLLIWDPAHGTDVIEADRFEREHGPFTHKIITRARPVRP